MQLHAATSRGDVRAMDLALRSGAEVNARDSNGKTPLIFALDLARAFERRHGPRVTVEAVKFLVQHGAGLEAADDLGLTAIHYAAGIADPSFLEALLELGADPKHVTNSNYSVLTHACYQPSSPQKRQIVRSLCGLGVSPDLVTDYAEFPLGVCLFFGDLETMRLLIELGASTDALNWTTLHRTVAWGEIAEIARLAPTPKQINAVNERFAMSPWLLSFVRGDLEIVRWLAEHGGDLTQRGRSGETLMQLAARFGHEAVLRWLREIGADPNALDSSWITPLQEAAEWNHVTCASALLKFGANINNEDHVRSQPIHCAHSLEMIEILVMQGRANPNAINGCGEWPLKSAAQNNDVDRIQWLLNHGGEVDLTSTGETALHEAVQHDSREAIELLLKAGANPNQQDVDGWTPLFNVQSLEAIAMLRAAGADPSVRNQAGSIARQRLKDPILSRALKN